MITEGESPDFLHIVLSGSVDLFASWNGRETSLATVRPLSTFVLAASVRNAPYLMSARTLEKSRIVLLPSEDVRAVFDTDAAFARAIVTELAQLDRKTRQGFETAHISGTAGKLSAARNGAQRVS